MSSKFYSVFILIFTCRLWVKWGAYVKNGNLHSWLGNWYTLMCDIQTLSLSLIMSWEYGLRSMSCLSRKMYIICALLRFSSDISTFINRFKWWMYRCRWALFRIQYIPRNMHTVFALLCFVVVIHWLIFPYPSGLLHWHCGNLTIAPVPAKQPWRIWINTSCEFIMNDYITTTKQSTTKPCAYFLGYTVGYTAKQTKRSTSNSNVPTLEATPMHHMRQSECLGHV